MCLPLSLTSFLSPLLHAKPFLPPNAPLSPACFARGSPSPCPCAAGTSDGGSGLGTGAIVGILIVVFFLLLVGIDVTCYFLNKCGLLMCIAVNFCGKAGPGAKSKDMEEGKAAFTKDESKEPIVEVRTEEEHTPNQGGGATEPNETTPLTEPEPAAADTTSTVVNFPSTATNSVAESFSTAQSSPASESTSVTTSSTKAAPAGASPQNSPVGQTNSLKANAQPDIGPLVDLSEAPKDPSLSKPTLAAPEAVGPPSANEDGPQSQCDPAKAPDSIHSKDLEVDGPTKDVPTESATPAQNDGKTVKDDKTKGETEAKNATTEVKTVPNEAPQSNGNESKA